MTEPDIGNRHVIIYLCWLMRCRYPVYRLRDCILGEVWS